MAVQSWRSLGKLSKAPSFAGQSSVNAFQQRLVSTEDPTKLRAIALAQRERIDKAEALLDRLFATMRRRERAILICVSVSVVLVLAFYLFELRAPPPD